MRQVTCVILLLASLGIHPAFAEEPPAVTEPSTTEQTGSDQLTAEQEKYFAFAQQLWASLEKKHGEVKLPNGVATLKIPDDFFYLSPGDAEKVLVDIWGNPPGQPTLGMIFPANTTPFDEGAWAVTVEYEEDGYVSDSDADKINYDELLSQMQDSTREASAVRVSEGYEAIELVGWAAPPFYEKDSHKLHWAKELKFGDEDMHTLNYNIRVLGRKGVLVLNFIASMEQKPLIDASLNSVLAMAEFDQGSRYEDFNPEYDKIAAYGLGALVAGKLIAKTGLFAAALIFLKKFGVIILVGVGALLGKLFKRQKSA